MVFVVMEDIENAADSVWKTESAAFHCVQKNVWKKPRNLRYSPSAPRLYNEPLLRKSVASVRLLLACVIAGPDESLTTRLYSR